MITFLKLFVKFEQDLHDLEQDLHDLHDFQDYVSRSRIASSIPTVSRTTSLTRHFITRGKRNLENRANRDNLENPAPI